MFGFWRCTVCASPYRINVDEPLPTGTPLRQVGGHFYYQWGRRGKATSIDNEHGIPFVLTFATFLRTYALALAHRQEEIAEMRRVMSTLGAQGVRFSRNFAMLAEACTKNGLPEEALSTVAEGLAVALRALRQRRGPNIAAVALANKNARVLWALLARAEEYRDPVAA